MQRRGWLLFQDVVQGNYSSTLFHAYNSGSQRAQLGACTVEEKAQRARLRASAAEEKVQGTQLEASTVKEKVQAAGS